MSKEDEVIAKVRAGQPNLSAEDEARMRETVRAIEADPNICSKCWSGGAYLDGRLVCDCWTEEEISELETGFAIGAITRREDGDITHYTTRKD